MVCYTYIFGINAKSIIQEQIYKATPYAKPNK